MVEKERSTTLHLRQGLHYLIHQGASPFKAVGRPGKPESAGVYVSDTIIRVPAPHGGGLVIPRAAVSRVWHVRAKNHRTVLRLALLFGACTDFRGHWWLARSLDKLVAIDIDPPAVGRVWGIAIRPRRVVVSIEDPDRFITDVLA